MKKIALLMASAAVAAVISGCTAMQYAPDELKWTTKHSDDEIYGKAVDCATSMLGTPQNGEQFFVYESDKLHKFTTKSWVQIRPNPILTAWASVLSWSSLVCLRFSSFQRVFLLLVEERLC